MSIYNLIHGNMEDGDIENNRQEDAGGGFSARC